MLRTLSILSLLTTSAGFQWAHQWSRGSTQQLSMGSKSGLADIKDRYRGRADLPGMIDLEEESIYTSFTETLQESNLPPKTGDTVTGRVVEIDDNGALLHLDSSKMSGYIPSKEAALIPVKDLSTIFEIGQEITADVVGTLKGMPVMSLRGKLLLEAWGEIAIVHEKDEIFEVKVLEVNRGGAVCAAFGLKAFLPGSHFLGVPDESLIGNMVSVKFLDVTPDEGKIVLSQRRALAESQVPIERGSVLKGTITGLRNYGAFLELESGTAGLLHISQISYDRIDNLESMFTIGQEVKVMVIEYDQSNGRVALSTKTLEPNPGDMKKDMQLVFDNADATAKLYHERMEKEKAAREAAAKDIVAGLGGLNSNSEDSSSSSNADDQVTSVADSIESILASIVSDGSE